MKKLILIALLLTSYVTIGQIIPKVDGLKIAGKSAPISPTDGEIYYNSTSKKTFQWNGTAWIDLSSVGAVTSVAGKTGVVTLVNADITDLQAALNLKADDLGVLKKDVINTITGLTRITESGSNTGISIDPSIDESIIRGGSTAGGSLVEIILQPNSAIMTGYSNAEINAAGALSLITKSYADANYSVGFVDLTTAQTISGGKTFSGANLVTGSMSISGTLSGSGSFNMQNGEVVLPGNLLEANKNTVITSGSDPTGQATLHFNPNGVLIPLTATPTDIRYNGTSLLSGGTPQTLALSGTNNRDLTISGGNTVTVPGVVDNEVTSIKILDGAIVNADVNASAAIAASKLANTPSGNLLSTTVQGALNELQTDINNVTSAAPLQITASRTLASTDLNRILWSNAGTELTLTIDTGLGVDGDVIYLLPYSASSVLKPIAGSGILLNTFKTTAVVGEHLTYRKVNSVWVGEGRDGVAYTVAPNLYDNAGSRDLPNETILGTWSGNANAMALNTNLTFVRTGTTSLQLSTTTPATRQFRIWDLGLNTASTPVVGQTYKLSFWAKSGATLGTQNEAALVNTGTGSVIITGINTSTFTYFEIQRTITVNNQLLVYLYTDQTMYVDDVRLELVN
jgi:hypothetical protein